MPELSSEAPRPANQRGTSGDGDRFFDQATHQVWALHAVTREWLYLPDGAADSRADPRRWGERTWKQLCNAGELLCPLPACGQPFSTARGGTRRHCFVHGRGVTHSGTATTETWWHLNAKQTIAVWARSTMPDADVAVDDVQVFDGDGRRQPDVLITLPDGRRIAVELQYSTLTEPQWRARHAFYQRSGILDLWLFAHVGPQFRLHDDSTAQWPKARLLSLHQAMLKAGVVPVWFNPVWRRVATANGYYAPKLYGLPGTPTASRKYHLPPGPKSERTSLAIDNLDQLMPDWNESAVLTPARRRQLDEATALAAEKAAVRQATIIAAPTRVLPVPAPEPEAPPQLPEAPLERPAAPEPPETLRLAPLAPSASPASTPVAPPFATRASRRPWWRRMLDALRPRR